MSFVFFTIHASSIKNSLISTPPAKRKQLPKLDNKCQKESGYLSATASQMKGDHSHQLEFPAFHSLSRFSLFLLDNSRPRPEAAEGLGRPGGERERRGHQVWILGPGWRSGGRGGGRAHKEEEGGTQVYFRTKEHSGLGEQYLLWLSLLEILTWLK